MTGHGGKREGAGRPSLPKKEKKKNLTVTLKPEDKSYLKTLAWSYSKAIEKLIRYHREGK